jgi:hypothetical protein
MAEANELTFGTPVKASVELVRRHGVGPARVWKTEEIVDADSWGKVSRERTGIIVGKRTLADGDYFYGSMDEPGEFVAGDRFAAYLVAYAMHRAPFLVRAEDLELIDTALAEDTKVMTR